jgi:NAD(P)-dependent dehydrogenase (short-subunit alcohol dehydrogenase family)
MSRVLPAASRKKGHAQTWSRRATFISRGVWNTIEKHNPEQFKMILSLNPMGRIGAPGEAANAAVFLASPRAASLPVPT